MNPLGPHIRTLEVHPVPFTRLLNRYPSSGNGERDPLGVPLLLQAIGDSASLGYNLLHIAGDEPLQCSGLHSLCGAAHQAGMQTTIQIRQSLINERLLKELDGSVDLLGAVLEGRMVAHGRARKCPRLQLAREHGTAVAVIFKLTRSNLDDLEWATQLAAEHGARALLVRAPNLTPDQIDTAWMMIEALRDICRGRLEIGFASPNRYNLPPVPDLTGGQHDRISAASISDAISPLVIDNTGLVLPLFKGVPRSLQIGDLQQRTLPELARLWIARRSANLPGRMAARYRERKAASPGASFSICSPRKQAEAGRRRSPSPAEAARYGRTPPSVPRGIEGFRRPAFYLGFAAIGVTRSATTMAMLECASGRDRGVDGEDRHAAPAFANTTRMGKGRAPGSPSTADRSRVSGEEGGE